MGNFPCKHNFGDVIKFKYRGRGIVEGQIVGCIVSAAFTGKQYVEYLVHSLSSQKPTFHFKPVSEDKIIR